MDNIIKGMDRTKAHAPNDLTVASKDGSTVAAMHKPWAYARSSNAAEDVLRPFVIKEYPLLSLCFLWQ